MAILFSGLASLFGGGAGAAAAGAAGAAATVGTTVGTGLSLGTILQGTATVLGVIASIGAGNAEAERQELEAMDAEREQELEMVQGVERRSSIKRQMMEAVGAQDVAYAASGVDLSVGTAAQARNDAYRDADLGLTTSTGTEQVRTSRLMERAANYRTAAKQSRSMGFINGLAQGLSGFASIARRGA